MRTLKFFGFHTQPFQQATFLFPALFLGMFLFLPALSQAQYGTSGAPYTQTGNLDNCTSSSVSLNTMAINQFYLYSASGVSVLYAAGVNPSGANTIVLQAAPPANATIVQAYLEVVEEWNGYACSNAPVSFGSGLTPAGVESGQGNFENTWKDPNLGNDVLSGASNFFCNVRYDVTSLVSPGVSGYSTNALSGGVLAGLVVVYTVPSSNTCGAVALGDGLFAWGGSTISGNPLLDYGVTPWYSTLDWSCQHSVACAANQFSRWGGVSAPNAPANFTDNFYGTENPGTGQPPNMAFGAGTIFQDSSSIYDTFLDTYHNVPLSNSSGKITWALGNPLSSGYKDFYWVNLLAASCNSICNTPTPTFTPTSTNTGTSTFTPTITFTPTASFTFTFSLTPTNSPTATPSATPTISFTATNSSTVTPTLTPTNSPTLTPTSTPSDSSTPTPTDTNSFTLTSTFTNTLTFTQSFTPTITATPSNSPTVTPTSTTTSTATNSPTPTYSLTSTFTNSATPTPTATLSFTPTDSMTPSPTFSATASPTDSPSATPTATLTITPTPTATPTLTLTSTFTLTSTSTRTFTVTITPTPTVSRTPTSTAIPTATFPPDCDEFYVSRNSFRPGQEAVSIHVAYCNYQGQFSLRLYNSAGEHIKTLDERMLNGSFQSSYSWDGTNKYGDSCASGVYIFYLVEPFQKKLKRVLLIR